MQSPPILALIVPCYLEEETLPATNRQLLELLNSMKQGKEISEKSFLLYVDDCSNDSTWKLIQSFASENVKGIKLSPHSGHQQALLAGMETAIETSDVCITIDADLQDDIRVIPEMIRMYREGAQIVYGIRDSRKTDSWFKRFSAKNFYRSLSLLGVDSIPEHGDFRLMSANSIKALGEYKERNLFLRGIVPRLGFPHNEVYYSRLERKAGLSKYNFKKMAEFAIDGITSFSVTPVRLLFWLGLIFMLVATAIGIYTLVRYFTGETIEGWASLILSIWFCTGILLMGMGIMGEYIGKIYIEVKRRPRYRISESC